MKDSTNEFSAEKRAKISQEAAGILDLLQKASTNDFACGINKGFKKQGEKQFKEVVNGQAQEIKSLNNHHKDPNLFNAVEQAYTIFLKTQPNSTKYILKDTDWANIDPMNTIAQVLIEPKEATFFKSNVGPTNKIEIFALIIVVKVCHLDSKTSIEIISHFNPEVFKNVRIEYLDIINTGTYRHLYKDLTAADMLTSEDIKFMIIEKLNEALTNYNLL